MGSYLLGVDAGLTNLKAVLFDRKGEEKFISKVNSATERPAPDREERDMNELWKFTKRAIRNVVDESGVNPGKISGVGVAGHGHGLYLLDERARPVRKGIKSTDSRAIEVVDEWRNENLLNEVFQITGYKPFAADPLSLLAWLKREEKGNYRDINRIVFCKDFLKFKLTGSISTDEMESSVFTELKDGVYSDELFEVLGIEECRDKLPEITPSWKICGRVTEEASRETGLEIGTPVASGLHDIGATALGAGAINARQAVLIVGTWGESILVMDEPNPDPERGGIIRKYLKDKWIHYKGSRSAASALDWFVDSFCSDWGREAQEMGIDPHKLFDEKIGEIPPVSEGLMFLPYLHGYTDDPSAKACFYGVSEHHTKEHFLRAIYEGVAISMCKLLRDLETGGGPEDVRIGGGGSKSEIWTRIFADVFGQGIGVPTGNELGARGAALCAGIATNVYEGHEEAVGEAVELSREATPDRERVKEYESAKKTFNDLIERVYRFEKD